MEESRLIELSKLNNKDALSILLSQNYNIVYGYMIKLTCDVELAKDLTQETMVKAIVQLKSFKGNSLFSTWLITIGTNLYKNYKKKNKRLTLYDDLNEISHQMTPQSSVDDQVATKTLFVQVMKIINNFKDEQRLPFILKHYYSYSYEEIADILKCPIGTVRSRIHNTIKKVQKEMKGVAGDDM